MPQGISAAQGWFVKVINEVMNGLDHVAAYLDDVIVFDVDPSLHVANIKEFFLGLRQHNLKLSPSKATIGATDADFLAHTISRRHHTECTKKWSADENAHAGRSETAALPFGGSFLLQEISVP